MISSAIAPRFNTPTTPVAQPQSLLKAAGLGAAEAAYDAGDVMGRVVGGTASIGGAVGGAYLGSLGGAATMGLLGVGAGVPTAVLMGKSGLALLGGAFATGGALMQVGILIGTACGAAGGYYLGEKLGYAAGFVPAAVVSAPIGAVSGAARHVAGRTVEGPELDPVKHEERRQVGKVEGFASTVVMGIGGLSGLAGGAAIGGLAASGTTAVSGLLAKDLALSAIMAHGLTGAIIGGTVGAVLLGVGGYKLVHGIGNFAHNTARNLARGKEGVELDMKDKELDKRMAGLNQAEADLTARHKDAEGYFAREMARTQTEKTAEDASAATRIAAQDKRKTDMDQTVHDRNAAMDTQEAHIADKTANQDRLAQQRADARLVDLQKKDEAAYQTRKSGLETYQRNLDARQTEYDRKNSHMPEIVDQESSARRDRTQADYESKYQTRKGQNDSHEQTLKGQQSALDARRADLPNLIHKEGDRLLGIREGELKTDLGNVEAGLQRDLQAHQSDLSAAYQRQSSEYDSQLRSHENDLKAAYDVIQSDVSRLNSQVQNLQATSYGLQQNISQAQSSAANARSQASSILNNLESERSALQNEAQQARSEASSLHGQLSSAQSRLSSAQSQASSARADYERSAQEYNQLQADINSLNNQLGNRT